MASGSTAKPSRFLTAVFEVPELIQNLTPGEDGDLPELQQDVNPMLEHEETLNWPLEPLGSRHEERVSRAARQVSTNQQRVQTTRVSRELAERRLDAEQRKFAAGTSTSFVVFQAQRDLAVARNNELRAILDFNRSLVDLDTVQQAPLVATTR